MGAFFQRQHGQDGRGTNDCLLREVHYVTGCAGVAACPKCPSGTLVVGALSGADQRASAGWGASTNRPAWPLSWPALDNSPK